MKLPSTFPSLKPRPCLEALECRRLLSVGLQTDPAEDVAVARSVRAHTFSDPRGDFLPTYTGAALPGLDVVAYSVTVAADRVIFYGKMAGPIAPTQDVGGLFLIGLDRGLGTPRFTRGTPVIGPNVKWDVVVRVNADGTGNFANQIIGTPPLGVVTILDPADIEVRGNHFTASLPLSLLTPGATLPPEQWTYNLWPRNAVVIGQNQHVSDLAPDDGNAPVQVLSRSADPGPDGDDARTSVANGSGAGAATAFAIERRIDDTPGASGDADDLLAELP